LKDINKIMPSPKKKVLIIGAGFAGLSAASFLAQKGWQVTVIEKHDMPGGRARKFEVDGFTYDMGPSWYWMPDVFEKYFSKFGKKVSDYYNLKRLDPSYSVYFDETHWDMPANYEALQKLLESVEPGAAKALDQFMAEAKYKYDVGVGKLVHKPGQSLFEFIDWEVIKGVFKLDIFKSMKKHVAHFFKHPYTQSIMEFPVLFLGALPQDTPALYSLMNYADIKGGTWYPEKGMFSIVEGMYKVAIEQGVQFYFGEEVKHIDVVNGVARSARTMKKSTGEQKEYQFDVIVGAGDYHHIETKLLDVKYQSYTNKYWDDRLMAPSSILYYVGLNKKLTGVQHHNLFFDAPFDEHAFEIYTKPSWPKKPLFYASAASITDPACAPENAENLFFLIPLAPGLNDSEEMREKYFQMICERFEKITGENISDAILFKRSYAMNDFVKDYHSHKGNAYGLANTLWQTAFLKPKMRSKKLKNLFYTGQLTVPGPGVPPSIISGQVAAKETLNYLAQS
jgi:phytoene desaturase